MYTVKIETIALSSVVSLAFSILLSKTAIGYDKALIVLLIWGSIAGMILGNQEVKKIAVNIKLAIVPAAVLCLAPTLMALLRALLAAAASVNAGDQSFFGYSIFYSGWWHTKPLFIAFVLCVSFLTCLILLTFFSLAGGRMVTYLSLAYSAGPESFERVEKITKRILAIIAIITTYFFMK